MLSCSTFELTMLFATELLSSEDVEVRLTPPSLKKSRMEWHDDFGMYTSSVPIPNFLDWSSKRCLFLYFFLKYAFFQYFKESFQNGNLLLFYLRTQFECFYFGRFIFLSAAGMAMPSQIDEASNKLTSPLRCRRALCRHPLVRHWVSGNRRWVQSRTQSPNIAGVCGHASFCFEDASSCVCDTVFLLHVLDDSTRLK